MRNWLIKKLGGYTKTEVRGLRSALRQAGHTTMWAMNHQHEKVYCSAKHFFTLAGYPSEMATLAAKGVEQDNWDRIH